MAAEKVTVMILKVDLQCPCCYKKVKKILCKFPQIRNQVFDEKANKVTISVVCCSPEKIRDKLCCKGCKVIKSIEIVKPPKPNPKEPENTKEPEKTKQPKESEKPTPPKKPKEAPKPTPQKNPEPAPPKMPDPKPISPIPTQPAFPVRTCCGPCYEGYGGGPCYHGYGVPPPPQPCYDGYYGYGGGHHGRATHVTRCDYYFSEENPQGCSIM